MTRKGQYKLDLTNQKIGKRLVIERDKNDYRKWICKCDCGYISSVYGSNLKNGKSNSCYYCDSHIINTQYNDLVQHAKKRNIDVLITKEELYSILEKQNFKCALTGLPIIIVGGKNNTKQTTASPDRIDPTKEYELNNIQYVHKIINYMKMDLSQEDFIMWCNLVSNKGKKV